VRLELILETQPRRLSMKIISPQILKVNHLAKKQTILNFFNTKYKINKPLIETIDGNYVNEYKTGILENPNLISSITVNPYQYKNCFVVDCDHDDVEGWRTSGIVPTPTMTIKNKHNGRHHHVWWLKKPIPFYNKNLEKIASEKSMNFFKNIELGLRQELDGDPNYKGTSTKNFLNDELFDVLLWEEDMPLYEMGDFRDVAFHGVPVKFQKRSSAKLNDEKIGEGRNSRVFEQARWPAYTVANQFDNYEEFEAAVQDIVFGFGSLEVEPLSVMELRGISKSIVKYIWEKHGNYFLNPNRRSRSVKTEEQKKENRVRGQAGRRRKEMEEAIKKWALRQKKRRFYTILGFLNFRRDVVICGKKGFYQITYENNLHLSRTSLSIPTQLISAGEEWGWEFDYLEIQEEDPPPWEVWQKVKEFPDWLNITH